MRLLLIRHTVPDIPPGHCYGRLDVPARTHGLAAWLADWDAGRHPGQPWRGFGRLLSSPALRCVELARALSDRMDLAVETDPCWREMDFGAWEGLSWDAIGRAAVDAWAADPVHHAPGGGESALAMMRRVARGGESVRAAGRDAILVCHGGTIRMLRAWRAARIAAMAGEAGGWPGSDSGDPAGLAARLSAACAAAVREAPPPQGEALMLEL
ncbi:histidine phosphatase family protein [Castellaniella denitrificans]|uniref:histidine phosphatase family protein n=1 Tax=Castellaniella denitrificans TaxID=56119 RepID=UPI0036108A66